MKKILLLSKMKNFCTAKTVSNQAKCIVIFKFDALKLAKKNIWCLDTISMVSFFCIVQRYI